MTKESSEQSFLFEKIITRFRKKEIKLLLKDEQYQEIVLDALYKKYVLLEEVPYEYFSPYPENVRFVHSQLCYLTEESVKEWVQQKCFCLGNDMLYDKGD
jgi:hypothetical protein